MKRTLSMITLAVLTIGLLGSCSKINERLDNLEKKVDGIENEQIATINGQIDGIKNSIKDLDQIRDDIGNLKQTAEAHGEDIFALQEADETLGNRIDNLEDYLENVLPNYAEKEWVKATYSTLEQYDSTCTAIAEINAKIGELDTKIAKDIKACADSMTEWINVKFKGYYTAAEMDAELAKMRAAVDSAKASGKISDTKADSVARELTKTKTAVDTAKSNIRKEYKAAIKTAIDSSEGRLTKALNDAINTVNGKIANLEGIVDALDKDIRILTGRIEALEGMIQAVTVIPAYINGGLAAVEGGILTIDCIISPASAAASLKKEDIKVLVNTVKTKAVSLDTAAVSDIKLQENGIISIFAQAPLNKPAPGDTLTAAVRVKDGENADYTTDFHLFGYSEENVKVVDLKENDKEYKKVYIAPSEENEGGIIPVGETEGGIVKDKKTEIEVRGIGNVTFNETAMSSIITNAGNATNVYFNVKDISDTKGSIDADVVYEVTMTANNESGEEVFSESKAGEGAVVTLQIPFGEDVAFVESVALVDENGTPIEGGVVEGSIVFDKEKHILTFQVNHFSKYAVGYLKKDEYKPVKGVSLDKTSLHLYVDKFGQLNVTVAPSDASVKDVIWSSSDTSKVTVDTSGKVTAKYKGTAIVTATTVDGGKRATCTVTVTGTRTMAEILATNPDIPKVEDMTPPANAWVNSADTACKAFVGYDGEDTLFVAYKRVSKDQETDEIISLGLCMDDTFEKIDGNTYKRVENGVGTFTAKMTEGKFTSFIFEAASGSDYAALNGTYDAPASDFVEMKMGTGESAYTLKWMKYNLGATTVAGSYATCAGDYYAWGEIEPYYGTITWNGDTGTFDNWLEGKSIGYAWLSYCGANPFVEWSPLPYDSSTNILKADYDAAKQKLGDGWRMPKSQEFKDLYDACGGDDKYNTTTKPGIDTQVDQGIYWCDNYDGVAGVLFCDGTNKLFFPAAGYGNGPNLYSVGSGFYWSSSLFTFNTNNAYRLDFSSSKVSPQSSNSRCNGYSVRPVSD